MSLRTESKDSLLKVKRTMIAVMRTGPRICSTINVPRKMKLCDIVRAKYIVFEWTLDVRNSNAVRVRKHKKAAENIGKRWEGTRGSPTVSLYGV